MFKRETKTQVKAVIRRCGSWKGVITGSSVPPWHVYPRGYSFGGPVVLHSAAAVDDAAFDYASYNPDLGRRAAFYRTRKCP